MMSVYRLRRYFTERACHIHPDWNRKRCLCCHSLRRQSHCIKQYPKPQYHIRWSRCRNLLDGAIRLLWPANPHRFIMEKLNWTGIRRILCLWMEWQSARIRYSTAFRTQWRHPRWHWLKSLVHNQAGKFTSPTRAPPMRHFSDIFPLHWRVHKRAVRKFYFPTAPYFCYALSVIFLSLLVSI